MRGSNDTDPPLCNIFLNPLQTVGSACKLSSGIFLKVSVSEKCVSALVTEVIVVTSFIEIGIWVTFWCLLLCFFN